MTNSSTGSTMRGRSQPKGYYLVLSDVPAISEYSNFMFLEDAVVIDRNLDDGVPTSGSVLAAGSDECMTGEINSGPYKIESVSGKKQGFFSFLSGNNKEPCVFLYVSIGSLGANMSMQNDN